MTVSCGTTLGSTAGSVGWTLLGFLIVAGLIAIFIKTLIDELETRKQFSILKSTPEYSSSSPPSA